MYSLKTLLKLIIKKTNKLFKKNDCYGMCSFKKKKIL